MGWFVCAMPDAPRQEEEQVLWFCSALPFAMGLPGGPSPALPAAESASCTSRFPWHGLVTGAGACVTQAAQLRGERRVYRP